MAQRAAGDYTSRAAVNGQPALLDIEAARDSWLAEHG
jgi:hypothetical protein